MHHVTHEHVWLGGHETAHLASSDRNANGMRRSGTCNVHALNPQSERRRIETRPAGMRARLEGASNAAHAAAPN
eukprot:8928891-Alexandrium_andersonii.AAC.1